MPDFADLDTELTGLDRAGWVARIDDISSTYGSGHPLGDHHYASFIDDGRNLLVAFETVDTIRKINPGEEPRGWAFVRDCGWSSMTIIAEDDTWYREPLLYDYFDAMTDDGIFDSFDKILFFGAGSGGYAAAAYSVSAPGARVLALQPQATLDPRIVGWDTRHRTKRHLDFNSRYGYAPDMIEAAGQAFVIHNPELRLDAMHAALFRRPNVTSLRSPRLSARIDRDFDQMQIMDDLIEATLEGAMDETVWSLLWRRRQGYLPYLRQTLGDLDKAGRYALAARLCRQVTRKSKRPLFQRKLEEYVANGVIPDPALSEATATGDGTGDGAAEPVAQPAQ